MKIKQLFICFAATIFLSGYFVSSVMAQSVSPEKQVGDTSSTNFLGISPDSEEMIFEKVEIEASVSMPLWRKHLEVNLLPYIERAANAKMKAGTYTVNVRFLVERNGLIKDVKALNDPGYGLAKGCERVVKTGPRWLPGEHKGKKVRSYHTQPITFLIQEVK